MVVELLTFRIDPADRDAWLEADAAVWSGFLARQPGFVRKEVWVSDDDPWSVRAVIWWETMAHWKAIDPEQVADVDRGMGPLLVEPTCRAFGVIEQDQTEQHRFDPTTG